MKRTQRELARRAVKQRRYVKRKNDGLMCVSFDCNARIIDWLIRHKHVTGEYPGRDTIGRAVEKMLNDLAENS
jgi:hypothetical protein